VESLNQDNVKRKIRCTVVSDKMSKTRVAKFERKVKHPLVGKYIKKTTKYFFHDENEQSHTGDEVLIVQTKPMSKNKCFKLLSIEKKQN
jgi:small subunit ribosomal protein S17